LSICRQSSRSLGQRNYLLTAELIHHLATGTAYLQNIGQPGIQQEKNQIKVAALHKIKPSLLNITDIEKYCNLEKLLAVTAYSVCIHIQCMYYAL